MWIPDEAAAELREAVTDEIRLVVAAFSDSQMEALLTGDLVAAHERVAVLTHSKETHHDHYRPPAARQTQRIRRQQVNQHKASNGTSVHLDSNGRMTFRRDSPLCVNTLEAFWVQAARAFFQAERDQELGRWRDPDNPDYVAYRSPEYDDDDGRCIRLLDETTGVAEHEWEQIDSPDPARRYFAAHPDEEPHKPWHDAKAGEYWLVTLEGADPIPTTAGNYYENLYFVVGDDDYYCPTNDHRIQNAVRLTPEGSSDE